MSPRPRPRRFPDRPPPPPRRAPAPAAAAPPPRRRGSRRRAGARFAAVLAVLLALAAVAGGVWTLVRDDTGERVDAPPADPLALALAHFPRGAPLALAVPGDPDALEWRNLDRLRRQSGVEIPAFADLRLGELGALVAGDVVVGLSAPGEPLAVAVAEDLEGLDAAIAQRVDERRLEPLSTPGRYRAPGVGVLGRRGRIVVGARTEPLVARALERGETGAGLRRASFDQVTERLPRDAFARGLVRVDELLPRRYADVPWLAAMGVAGLALSFELDRARVDAVAPTNGITRRELPWTPGTPPGSMPSAADPLRLGFADAAQALRVLRGAAGEPFERGDVYAKGIEAALATAGVALEADAIAPLGTGALLTGGERTAVVALPSDPARYADAVRRATPLVPVALRLSGRPGASVRGLDGLTLVEREGRVEFAFGVLEDRFVAGTGAADDLRPLGVAPFVRDPPVSGPIAIAAEPELVKPRLGALLGLEPGEADALPVGPLAGSIGGDESRTELQLTLTLE